MTDTAAHRVSSPHAVHADLHELVKLRAVASGFTFLPRQPVHSVLAGKHQSRLRGRGMTFEELRGYHVGDDVRHIDWKATARLRKPQVRVYNEERERPVLLVVDQRLSMFFGSRERTKSVTACEMAAIAAWRVLDQHDRIGAVIFNDTDLSFVRPMRSVDAVMRLLATMIEYNHKLEPTRAPVDGPSMLDGALERTARVATHDYLVCVISDFLESGPETRRFLTLIGAHNDVIAGLISDPLEQRLPQAGRLTFEKTGRQVEVDSASARLQRDFARQYEDRVEQGRRFLNRLGIPILNISTAGSVIGQIRTQLGQARGAVTMIAPESQPPSLDLLHDIVEPAGVPAWPPAAGWWVVIITFGVVCVWLLWVAIAWWMRTRYRRDALAELSRLRDSSRSPDTASQALGAVPALLKRTAIAVRGRSEVAALSGSRWTQFLDDTGGFPAEAGQALTSVAYGACTDGLSPSEATSLLDAAEAWIRAQPPVRIRGRSGS